MRPRVSAHALKLFTFLARETKKADIVKLQRSTAVEKERHAKPSFVASVSVIRRIVITLSLLVVIDVHSLRTCFSIAQHWLL